MRWYNQAGTPVVSVIQSYDAAARSASFRFTQATPSTPGQAEKQPVEIPIAMGLLSADGKALALDCEHPDWREDGVFTLRQASAEVSFRGLDKRPTASLLRGFSAPVRLDQAQTVEELLLLAGHDEDGFNRWQAIQSFAARMMLAKIREADASPDPAFDTRFFAALAPLLTDEADHAFAAEALSIPSEQDLAREIGSNVDPDTILRVREALLRGIGRGLETQLLVAYQRLATNAPYSPDAKSAARRSLRNGALGLLVIAEPERHAGLAKAQFATADNMNDKLAALAALMRAPAALRQETLAEFERAHADDPLILDKWFALQARIPEAGTLAEVKRLTGHAAFSFSNPNRVYALLMSFATGNPSGFNRLDGEGYDFITGVVGDLDATNPSVAARLLTSFRTWRSMEPRRRAAAEAALRRLAGKEKLSTEVGDILTRSLA
jgi:aminopeptidase N